MQECLINLWRAERDKPGKTRSWYLQNCRFHLQHCAASGRSLDSPKRASQDKRLNIDGIEEGEVPQQLHTNGEFFETVSFRDVVRTLASHLKPRERVVLHGLADGFRLREIAAQSKLSYPTALTYRRKIAALATKLDISKPLQDPNTSQS